MPSTASSALSVATSASSSSSRRRRGEPVERAAHADLVRGLLLVARVDLARRIVADEHDVEAGDAAVLRDERVDARADLGADGLGELLAVEDGGCHRR